MYKNKLINLYDARYNVYIADITTRPAREPEIMDLKSGTSAFFMFGRGFFFFLLLNFRYSNSGFQNSLVGVCIYGKNLLWGTWFNKMCANDAVRDAHYTPSVANDSISRVLYVVYVEYNR